MFRGRGLSHFATLCQMDISGQSVTILVSGMSDKDEVSDSESYDLAIKVILDNGR